MKGELKSLALVSFILSLYFGVIAYLLSLLNVWFLKSSFFGITYKNIDIRVVLIGFIFALFGIWLIVEVTDYLYKRELRRKNKWQ